MNSAISLHDAINNNPESVKSLIAQTSSKALGATDKDGNTALLLIMHKIHDLNPKKVIGGLEKFVPLKVEDKDRIKSLLQKQCEIYREIAELLIAKMSSGDINAKDKDGYSAFSYAISDDQPGLVKLLVPKVSSQDMKEALTVFLINVCPAQVVEVVKRLFDLPSSANEQEVKKIIAENFSLEESLQIGILMINPDTIVKARKMILDRLCPIDNNEITDLSLDNDTHEINSDVRSVESPIIGDVIEALRD